MSSSERGLPSQLAPPADGRAPRDPVVLRDRYELRGELGRGGAGRVLAALDRASGELRALKIVPRAHAARLQLELEALRKLSHPHLAAALELLEVEGPAARALGAEPGALVLVEELAEGHPANEVANATPDEELVPRVLRIAEAVARALAMIHGAGLVHGDVKPANIVATLDGKKVKLVDLGLARPPGVAPVIAGSLATIAPEALTGELFPRSDVYSLGATMYRLLSRDAGEGGSTQRDSALDVGREVRATLGRVYDPAELPELVPPPARRLIASLTTRDPAQRPQSARDALARVLACVDELAPRGKRRSATVLDEQPSALERANAVHALPFVGATDVATIVASIEAKRAVIVCGARGSGRGRVVREAVRAVQERAIGRGEVVPTYVRGGGVPQAGPVIAHVEEASAMRPAELRALVQELAWRSEPVAIVLEVESDEVPATILRGTLDEAPTISRIEPLSRSELGALLAPVLGAAPSDRVLDAALRATGGLAARACIAMASAIRAGRDLDKPDAWLAFSSEDDVPDALLPGAAGTIALALTAAGGVLPAEALAAIVPAAARAGAFAQLVTAGLSSTDGQGRLALRVDVADALARREPNAIAEVARAIPDKMLDDVARGFVLAARGEGNAAEVLVGGLRGLRRRGLASEVVDAATRALDRGLVPREPIAIELADALRAEARYDEAEAALHGTTSPLANVVGSEIARLRGEVQLAAERAQRARAGGARGVDALEARIALDRGDLAGARSSAERAIADAPDGEPSNELLLARPREVLCWLELREGRLDRARVLAEQALELAGRVGARATMARAHALIASVALAAGDVRAACERFARARDLSEEAGERHAAATFAINLGIAQLDAGQPGPAIAYLRAGALRLLAAMRVRDSARALYNLGNAAVLVGDDDLARSALHRAREGAREAGDDAVDAFGAILEAESTLREGHMGEARPKIDDACAIARQGSAGPREKAIALARGALLYASLGDRSAAQVARDDARAISDHSEAVGLELALADARIALLEGDADRAREASLAGYAAARAAGTYEAKLRASLLAAECAQEAGSRLDARRFFAEARSLLDTAARSLSIDGRARLLSAAAYQRALASVPQENDRREPTPDRYRKLVLAARSLTAERRVSRLHEEILDAAIDATGASRGVLVERTDTGFVARAARGLRADVGFSRSIVEQALATMRPFATLDASIDERVASASIHAMSLRSVLVAPLSLGRGKLGAIYLDDRLRPAAFEPDDIESIGLLADLAGIALEGAELLRRERSLARKLARRFEELERTAQAQALEIEASRRALSEGVPGIVAASEAMRSTLALALRVAESAAPVLIRGESGTGKELVARAIHDRSSRRDKPFVTENCGAIPEPLLESALFGHVRGAFTGADRTRVGLFEAANGGTLFLDEIGEMSAGMQAKLLRAAQDGEIRPVGGTETRRVDVRILGATHRNLEQMVREGRFREDLYYRLAVVTLDVPPLRDREGDVPLLVAHFIDKHAKGREVRVERRAMARLVAFRWPGNVRQLENEVRRALILAQDHVREAHLSPALREGEVELAAETSGGAELDLKSQVDELERRLLRRALERTHGNQTQAAKLLGVSRFGLQKMMKRLAV